MHSGIIRGWRRGRVTLTCRCGHVRDRLWSRRIAHIMFADHVEQARLRDRQLMRVLP